MATTHSDDAPSLYGIKHSNRNPGELWGKNIFNNAFPMSLASWMRDKRIDLPTVITRNGVHSCECQSPDFLLGLPTGIDPYFQFESSYSAHSNICSDKSERVDVVICDNSDHKHEFRYLEIKLIVVPDKTTSKDSPELWAPEIVFRPSTSTNCALSVFRHLKKLESTDIALKELEPVCSKIHSWGNPTEMKSVSADLLPALRRIVTLTESLQEPAIACAVWRTEGVSPILAENAFDIIAWSNTAFMLMMCDKAESGNKSGISRPLRSALRSCRILYDLLTTKTVYLERIISDMSFETQTDKDFAISGRQSIKYMKHQRLLKPAIRRETLESLIQGPGIERLSPERRLDATLYFAYKYAAQR